METAWQSIRDLSEREAVAWPTENSTRVGKKEGKGGSSQRRLRPLGMSTPKRNASIHTVRWSSMNPAVRASYVSLLRFLGFRPEKPLIADGNQPPWRRYAIPWQMGDPCPFS